MRWIVLFLSCSWMLLSDWSACYHPENGGGRGFTQLIEEQQACCEGRMHGWGLGAAPLMSGTLHSWGIVFFKPYLTFLCQDRHCPQNFQLFKSHFLQFDLQPVMILLCCKYKRVLPLFVSNYWTVWENCFKTLGSDTWLLKSWQLVRVLHLWVLVCNWSMAAS